MVTNAKVTVDDVKKSAASAATTVKSAVASAPATTKKVVDEVKKEVATKKIAAKKTVAKKTTAKKTTAKKTTAKKATTKKKAVTTTAVVQYQDREFTEAECLKKAQAQFKKDYKGKTLEELNIYIKPEERKIYYVANKDSVGSVEL
ncbi:DUF6465 family protein [Pseudobutyrivibrio xylanivorans]|uniref:Uncharacterized protein n=1 Tax=Pseudobutyrivibrio xylanivorans DSM 14809 TaxID=1123012 RepID=A0A1M6HRY4_PSEXY|nr:DUF6465 family protein [Pseudobutyrivibrio xylanivorans]SHJ24918.1 hypothetical protein SAMN02745725_02075 [Pseudobutyrivibrio xylanivorans DSM 14809]